MTRGSSQNYHVSPSEARLTLSAALRHWLTGQSWSHVRQLLQNRQVQVNGNLCLDEARRLKVGDVVKVTAEPLAKPPDATDVQIQFLDADLVVVEKPAGMTTMRHVEERFWPARRKQLQPTLDEVLPAAITRHMGPRATRKRPKPNQINPRVPFRDERPPKPPRIRPVHRLDRDTSGLMVFARSVPAEQHLIKQFAKHTIERVYQAIVLGTVEARTIESYLIRDRGDGKRGSSPHPEDAQRAVTHVRPLEQLNGYTLVECRLETGRTHQIRIHLAECGHVVCGEKIYHQPLKGKPLPDRSGAPRIALHAAELGFEHPLTQETLHFHSPLPDDMQDLLQNLRKL